MISQQAVLEVALCFAGRELTDGEENVLSILCGGALEQWLGRLREDVTEEDCQDLLVVASAWTALARNDRGFGAESAHAAVLFRRGPDGAAREDRTGDACARSLQSQAERLMEPYVQDGCFAFLEVEG